MYKYPDTPPRDTLQSPDKNFRADARLTGGYAPPTHNTIKNAVPDPVTDGAYQLPGKQLFAIADLWKEAPQPVDIVHREIHQPTLSNQLVYRSGLQTGRRESRNERILPPSVTSPGINSSTFISGKRGDVYGS